MGRTLPWGRITKSDDAELTDALRKAGMIGSFGNNGVYGNILDRLFFEAHGVEHILGSSSQLSSEGATITWSFLNGRFEDKAGGIVTLGDYERVAVIGMNTFTGNITIDNVTGLEMWHIGNTPLQAGNNPVFELGSPGGAAYKIKLGPNTENCKLDLLTDKPFEALTRTLTLDQKRYIANQGKNNYIKVNGKEIYNPSTSGEIIKLDALPTNPYLVRMNGVSNSWMADASNVNSAWFRDLNMALDGIRSDGTNLQETQSRFTISSLIATSPWLFQANTANRFFTDLSALDTRIHERTSPTASLDGIFAQLATGSDVVTFLTPTFVGDSKNYMRIKSSVLPDPTFTTQTVLIVDIDTTANTARMIDALTGSAVTAVGNVSEFVTVDNSGAAAGSIDEDALQNITGQFDIKATSAGASVLNDDSGALAFIANGGTGTSQGFSLTGTVQQEDLLNFDASGSPSARTHDQTQPKSSQVYYYYRP